MYRFTHKDVSVAAGIRRQAEHEAKSALKVLTAAPDTIAAEAIHDARRHFKKLRALLRLVEERLDKFRGENARIRDIARELSATRDADVMIATLGSVKGEADVGAILAELQGESRSLNAQLQAQRHELEQAIGEVVERIGQWDLHGNGFAAIERGLKRTYRRARDDMDEASKTRTPIVFHDWRKAVKTHWYHLALLRNCAPDMLKPEAALWGQLGDALGDHHDLWVLSQRLEGRAEQQLAAVRTAIEQRCTKLEDEALALGRQLLAERPRALARRLGTYWRDWRKD